MKKFAMVSMVICLSIMVFIGASKILFGDKILAEERSSGLGDISSKIEVTYKGYENTDAGTNIIIGFKNNTSKIVALQNIELDFEKKKSIGNFSYNSIVIKSFDKKTYDFYQNRENADDNEEPAKYGMEPGEEEEYIFTIPKGITFDEKIYDLNSMMVSYSGSGYTYRLSDNSLLGGFNSFGRSQRIENKGEPIKLDNNY